MSSKIFVKSEVAIDLGKRLRETLAKRDLSQANLAHKLGVSVTQISDWVSGRHRPTRATRGLIAALLGVSEKWLTEGIAPAYKEGGEGGEGQIAEASAPYLGKKERRLMEEINKLLDSGDEVVFQHLKRQVNLLHDAVEHRREKKKA